MIQHIVKTMVCDMPKLTTDTKDPLYGEHIFRSHVGTEDSESLSLVSVSPPSSLHTSCHTVDCSHSYKVLSEMIQHCCGEAVAAYS